MRLASSRPADRRHARSGLAALDGRLVAFVGVGLFAFDVAIQRGAMVSWDGRVMASVAKDLLQHGRLQMDQLFGTPHVRGAWSKYGIGPSLLMVPLWALQPHGDVSHSVWITLANPAVLAVSGAVICRIGIELGWRRTTAVGTAVAFGLLTMAPQYSTELLSEPGVLLGMVVALLGLLWWQRGRSAGPWCIGIGIGWAVLFRADSAFLVGPMLLAVPLFVRGRRLVSGWTRWLPALAIPVGAAAVWTGYYNNLRCGSPLCNTYAGEGFTFPLPSGLYRILLSPGKGFFWYNLILLMALPGFILLWRRHRGLTLTILAVSVLRILVYAKWDDPDGSVAWGPRFLLPLCALLALPAGELWQWLVSRAGMRRAVAVSGVAILAAASAAVAVASVWVGYDQVFAEILDPRGLQPSQYAAVQAYRMHRYFNSIRGSNISRDFSLLARSRPFPLLHFRGGPSAIGVCALLLSGAALFAAFGSARRVDRPVASGYRRRHAQGRLAPARQHDTPGSCAGDQSPGDVPAREHVEG